MDVTDDEISGVQTFGGTQADRFAKFTEGSVVLAEGLINVAEIGRRHGLPRINLGPELVGLTGLFQIAGSKMIVVGLNIKFFPFADAIAKVVGFPGAVSRETFLSKIVVNGSEHGMGHGEFRIEFDGTLEQRNGV